jgi:hypothetical protein
VLPGRTRAVSMDLVHHDRSHGAAGPATASAGPVAGKRSLTDGMTGPAQAGEVPYRGEMEAAFGRDFSSVEASTEPDAMAGLGAEAATLGNRVAFASADPDRRLVAHELTHVVQNHGDGGAIAFRGVLSDRDSAAEQEAEAVADRVAGGESAGPITAAPGATVQRFAPGHHETATIRGLTGHFSPEEIAATYAANWERDFSQGSPVIANAAIAWRALKTHAADHAGDVGPAGPTFTAAVWRVVDMNLVDAGDTSLGGYNYWEHMDQPVDGLMPWAPDPRSDAEARWAGRAGGLAGYLNDARAYIKDEMVAAVDVHRQSSGLTAVGTGLDNWGGAARPEGYVAPNVRAVPSGGAAMTMPAGWNDPNVVSRDPIREDTRRAAVEERGDRDTGADPRFDDGLWQLIGQHLGRAMHSFEDFWAHSNWLELAHELKRLRDAGNDRAAISSARLMTGTFTMPAQCHALGHKLLALATAFQADFDLLLRAYGRTEASTRLGHAGARRESTRLDLEDATGETIPASVDDQTSWRVFASLDRDAMTPAGELLDVGSTADSVEEAVQSGQLTMADFLCNREFLAALAAKGRVLIEEGDKESGPDSHGHIAKDQDEHGKDHGGAMALAVRANDLVFGPLRAIMDDRDGNRAVTAIQAQLQLVDRMLQAPSEGHPLWDLIAPPAAGDFPMPSPDVATG